MTKYTMRKYQKPKDQSDFSVRIDYWGYGLRQDIEKAISEELKDGSGRKGWRVRGGASGMWINGKHQGKRDKEWMLWEGEDCDEILKRVRSVVRKYLKKNWRVKIVDYSTNRRQSEGSEQC